MARKPVVKPQVRTQGDVKFVVPLERANAHFTSKAPSDVCTNREDSDSPREEQRWVGRPIVSADPAGSIAAGQRDQQARRQRDIAADKRNLGHETDVAHTKPGAVFEVRRKRILGHAGQHHRQCDTEFDPLEEAKRRQKLRVGPPLHNAGVVRSGENAAGAVDAKSKHKAQMSRNLRPVDRERGAW